MTRKGARRLFIALLTLSIVSMTFAVAASAQEAEVTVGSNDTEFSQNKQNEPWVAIDPSHPNRAAAGANDNIDMELCNAGDPTICPFTEGVGVSGVSLSNNFGHSWVQPNYTGYTARHCTGPAECVPTVGPIGTLPRYYENGLVSDGDPTLAFGPRPGPNGSFSWANGSRLYYASLASNFPGQQRFRGFEAITVSRTDQFEAAMTGANSAWMDPVIVTRQSSTTFSDKEAITVDDAASSPYFGNVYVCNVAFRSNGSGPEPVLVARSTDGGSTWSQRQLTAATNNSQTGGRQGCAIKTNSRGVVFVLWIGTDIHTRGPVIFQARSFNGGRTFERPRIVARLAAECGQFDPATARFSFDGVAGARTDSFPIVDIANGAPTGAGATDEVIFTYCDGPTPTNTSPGPNERAQVRYSVDGGQTYRNGGSLSPPADRPDFPALAISPDGTDLYATYTNFLQPWQSSALAPPRLAQGVTRTASVGANGAPGAWSDVDRGPTGDARTSSQNNLVAEFLGDYSMADATNTYGITVWNDVRAGADCPAIDAFREAFVDDVEAGTAQPLRESPRNRRDPSNHAEGLRPAPNVECPPTWGNSDIWSFTTAP